MLVSRSMRIPLLLAALGLVALTVCTVRTQETDSDCTRTIVEGVRHRLSAIETLSGTAVLRYLASERESKWSWAIRAESAASRLGDKGRQIPPLGRDHACLLDFGIDFAGNRWRTELVDLTNTGTDWTGVSTRAAENRDADPSQFYRLRVCDGETVYEYVRRVNYGYVRDAEKDEPPMELELLRWRLVATVEQALVRGLEGQGLVAVLKGEEVLQGNRCLKVAVRGPTESRRIVANLWVAPDLGQAAVRQEILRTSQDNKPISLDVVTAADFVELAPGVWCPKTARVDHFAYTAHPREEPASYRGADAWWYTEVIQWGGGPLTVQANDPVEITTPFPFPFDARVQYDCDAYTGDRVRVSPSWLVRGAMDHLLADMEPDALGGQLTEEMPAKHFGGGE